MLYSSLHLALLLFTTTFACKRQDQGVTSAKHYLTTNTIGCPPWVSAVVYFQPAVVGCRQVELLWGRRQEPLKSPQMMVLWRPLNWLPVLQLLLAFAVSLSSLSAAVVQHASKRYTKKCSSYQIEYISSMEREFNEVLVFQGLRYQTRLVPM